MFDCIVVGLGAVGSAALCHVARQGARVLGIDRYAPPHTEGSTHGGSRIIRKAYFEGPSYLPLLERAYVLWRALEEETGQRLLNLCGCLNIGAPGSSIIEGARRSAESFGVSHEVLTAKAIRRRFPAYHIPEGQMAVFEPDAGFIFPERCVEAQLRLARGRDAEVLVNEAVAGWKADGGGVSVTTQHGVYHARTLILCAGAWMGDLLGAIRPPLRVERVVNSWFHPAANAADFVPERCPAFIWETGSNTHLYGLPDFGEGVKAGLHHAGALVDHPDQVSRSVAPEDIDRIRAPLGELLPDAVGMLGRSAICLYTNTPDHHYLIDRFPGEENIVYASACSGHGFKASIAVGEVVADLVLGNRLKASIDAFRWRWS